MKNLDFPIGKTKGDDPNHKFNLNDPKQREEYFAFKAGKEIKAIKNYLASGKTFVGFLLGKKNSGKGTYSKLFMEAVGSEHVGHISVGDIVRDVHAGLSDPAKKKQLSDFLKVNYRGFHTLEEIDELIEGRSQSSLFPQRVSTLFLNTRSAGGRGRPFSLMVSPAGLIKFLILFF